MKRPRALIRYMMNRYQSAHLHTAMALIAIVVVVLPLCLVSCHDKNDASTEVTEDWAEMFFDEELASISADPDGEHFYIGTCDGSILIYNQDSIKKVKNTEGFERIYYVWHDTVNSLYWIGTRNKGLYLCELKNNNFKRVCSFTIPAKEDRYSVYEISVNSKGDSIYAGTSNGLYCLYRYQRTPCDMTEVWSLDTTIAGEPVVNANMIWYKDTLYFTAYNSHDKTSTIYKHYLEQQFVPRLDTCIQVVSRSEPLLYELNDTVMGMIGDTIFYLNCDKLPSPIGRNSNTIDFLKAGNVVFQVTMDTLYANGYARRLPEAAVAECRNLLVDDPLHDQVFLVLPHHLLRLPHHYFVQPKADRVTVSASCVDPHDNSTYFLIDNAIFKLQSGKNDELELRQTELSVPAEYTAKWMTCLNNKVYIVTDKNDLYCLNPFKLITSFGKSVTAISSFDNHIYVGIRDSLFVLENEVKKPLDLITEDGDTVGFPFVTAFASRDSLLFISTLNDGVYTGTGEDSCFYRDQRFNNYRFIRDIYVKNYIFILTNDSLLVFNLEGTDNHSSNVAIGCNRLFPYEAQNKIVAVSDYGIKVFTHQAEGGWKCDTGYYQDWHFRSKSCISTPEGRVLLVKDKGGVFEFRNQTVEGPKWLKIEGRKQIDWPLVILIACIVAILALLATLLFSYFQRRKEIEETTISKRNALVEIEELSKDNQILSRKIELYGLMKEVPDYLRADADQALRSDDIDALDYIIQKINQHISGVELQSQWTEKLIRLKRFANYIKLNDLKDRVEQLLQQDAIGFKVKLEEFLTYLESENERSRIQELLQSLDVKKPADKPASEILKNQETRRDELCVEINSSHGEELVTSLFNVFTLYARNKMVCGFIELKHLLDGIIKNDLEINAQLLNEQIKTIYQPWKEELEVDESLSEVLKKQVGKKIQKEEDKENVKQRNLFLANGEPSLWGVVLAIHRCGIDCDKNKVTVDEVIRQIRKLTENHKERDDYAQERTYTRNLIEGFQGEIEKASDNCNIAKFFILS